VRWSWRVDSRLLQPADAEADGDYFLETFRHGLFVKRVFVVFSNSPRPGRETPKTMVKKNREKISLGFLVDFFQKLSTRFFCKMFFVVLF
jgi:hypothetical protein